MIIITKSQQLQMQEVLCHPLGPLPASLATSNGLPRKTNKAQLGRKLEKLVQSTVVVPTPSTYLIDGMSLIQKLQVDHHTFGEIAEMALSRVLREGKGSSRINVVFDVYRDVSIKSVERESWEVKEISSHLKTFQAARRLSHSEAFCIVVRIKPA